MLDRNLVEIPETEIRETQVIRTVLGGRVVCERDRDEEPDILDEGLYEEAGRIVH